MKWPSERISTSTPKSFGMYEKAIPLMQAGVDVIHLEVGRPSFDTPEHIKAATKAALDAGLVHYGDFAGEAGLRGALSTRLKTHNDLDYSPDEIIVTNGLTHASFSVCLAALDPGDEVILLEPYYPQHLNKIEFFGGKIVTAPLDKEAGFRVRRDLIADKITPATKMIALVNPANPTGRVFTRDELQIIADLAIEHDLLVMSDEVYEQIVYAPHKHISIASLPGMRNRTFTMGAFTKAYAMDGWRVGYVAADRSFIPAILKATKNDVAHVNVFVQAGAQAAIEGPQDCIAEMVADDRRRRDLVVSRLNQMPGVICPEPEGAIYAFPDITGTGKSCQEIADELLHAAHVVVETGSFYGPAGEGHLRVCFGAEPYERIEEALTRMARYFSSLG